MTFVEVVEASIDPDTGSIVDTEAIASLLDDTVASLELYLDDLGDLERPSEVSEAHDAFVDEAETRLDQWICVADRAAEIRTFEELVVATLESPVFTEACVAVERSVADQGLVLDPDCE